MTTEHYNRLESGPIDQIDAAIWSGDVFHNRENLTAFRDVLARWQRGLDEAEQILNEIDTSN